MAGKRPKKLTEKQRRKQNIRLIVQSNELVEARYMFDTWEMRFFHFFASMINKADGEDKKYRIWLKEIRTAFKLNNNDSYHQLREAAKRLSDKSVYLNYEKDGIIREIKHRFIKFIDYTQEGQMILSNQEYVDVSIDKEMLPFLLHVQKNFDPEKTRYTSYDFRNVIELKPYSARIYQLLKKEEYRRERVLTVEEIKRQFNIVDEYKRFSTLYQRIIEPSFISINKHTDITIPLDKIEKLKRGRKIYAIRIPIFSKTAKEIAYLKGEPKQGNLFEIETIETESEKTAADIIYDEFEKIVVRDFGITPSVFIKMLTSNKYKKENIAQAIAVTRRAKFNQEIKKNIAGFFIKALKEGFTDEKIEKKKKVEAKQRKQKELEELKKEYLDKRADRIRLILETVNGARERVFSVLVSKPNEILEKRLAEMNLSLETVNIDDFRKDKTLRGYFIQGIANEYADQLSDIDIEYQEKIKSLDV